MNKQVKSEREENSEKDSTDSLLKRTWKDILKPLKRYLFFTSFFGLVFIIVGIVFTFTEDIFGLIPILMGLLTILWGALPFIIARSAFQQTKNLIETKNIPKLLKRTERTRYKMVFAIAALGDLGAEETIPTLNKVVKEYEYSSRWRGAVKVAREALDLIAIKQGYDNYEHLNREVRGREDEITISITKVHFIEELPEGAKCIVSHLELRLDMDEIIACPFCGGMAKKELLKEWLEEKSICPACRRSLRIEACPMVQLKEAK